MPFIVTTKSCPYLIFQSHVFPATIQFAVDSIHIGHHLSIIVVTQWINISKFSWQWCNVFIITTTETGRDGHHEAAHPRGTVSEPPTKHRRFLFGHRSGLQKYYTEHHAYFATSLSNLNTGGKCLKDYHLCYVEEWKTKCQKKKNIWETAKI